MRYTYLTGGRQNRLINSPEGDFLDAPSLEKPGIGIQKMLVGWLAAAAVAGTAFCLPACLHISSY